MELVRFLTWLMILGILHSFGCKKAEKDEHPEYYEKYIHRLNYELDIAKRTAILDSFKMDMRRFPVGVMDSVNFYRVLSSIFISLGDFKQALSPLERIDYLLKGNANPYYVERYVWNQYVKSECYAHMKNYDAGMDCLLEAKMVIINNRHIDHCKFIGYNQQPPGELKKTFEEMSNDCYRSLTIINELIKEETVK